MIVSGGKILGIHRVEHDLTFSGDGVRTPLGLDHGLLEEIHSTSAKLDKSAFDSWSAQTENWDIDEYTGGDGIRVYDHEISVSGKYLTSGDLEPYATSGWVEDNFLNKADYREYSAGNDYVRIDDHKIYGYDWTSAVSGVPFKLDTSAFEEYSAWADGTYLEEEALEPYATSAGLDPDQQYAMTNSGWAPVDIPDDTVMSGTSGISVQKIGDTWVVGTSAQYATSAWVQDELGKKQNLSDMSAYATSAWVDENFLTETDLGNVVASLYDRTATYEVNDYVIHDKRLYRCNTAISVAEEWNALHWTAVKSTDSFEGSAPGLVPAAESGDADKVLKGDGTWGEACSSAIVSYDAQIEELSIDFYSHTNEALIGGRWYPYVQIGNQLWLVDNLDYQWSGLIVGDSETSTSEQRANYFNDDQSTYGVNGNKYGLLYNWVAVKYLNDNKGTLLPSGWHVPSKDESDTLISFVGGSSTAGLKLKSATEWTLGYEGTNDYEFTAYPAGYRSRLGDYVYLGTETRFWNSTTTSYPEYQFFFLNNSDQSFNSATAIDYQFSVRLVKTLT